VPSVVSILAGIGTIIFSFGGHASLI